MSKETLQPKETEKPRYNPILSLWHYYAGELNMEDEKKLSEELAKAVKKE